MLYRLFLKVARSSCLTAMPVAVAALVAIAPLAGCDGGGSGPGPGAAADDTGSVSFALAVGNIRFATIDYSIVGPGGFTKTDSLDVSQSQTIAGTIGGLPAGAGYVLSMSATDVEHHLVGCHGATAPFDVAARVTTPVVIHLTCAEERGPPASVPLSPAAIAALALLLAAAGIVSQGRRRAGRG
jgi:hypothetical protein